MKKNRLEEAFEDIQKIKNISVPKKNSKDDDVLYLLSKILPILKQYTKKEQHETFCDCQFCQWIYDITELYHGNKDKALFSESLLEEGYRLIKAITDHKDTCECSTCEITRTIEELKNPDPRAFGNFTF